MPYEEHFSRKDYRTTIHHPTDQHLLLQLHSLVRGSREMAVPYSNHNTILKRIFINSLFSLGVLLLYRLRRALSGERHSTGLHHVTHCHRRGTATSSGDH